MATIKTFRDVVNPVYIDLSKVTGFSRVGSQLLIEVGGVQPVTVSFKTLEAAEKAETEFAADLERK